MIKYFRLACIVGISGLIVACATYRHTYLHFPIKVLTGKANLTFSIIPLKTNQEINDMIRQAKVSADNHSRKQKDNLHSSRSRPSPSEHDYLSRIRLKTTHNAPEVSCNTVSRYECFTPIQESIEAGKQFSLKIPHNCRIDVIITNTQPEILEFTCTGRLFRLMQDESISLKFR